MYSKYERWQITIIKESFVSKVVDSNKYDPIQILGYIIASPMMDWETSQYISCYIYGGDIFESKCKEELISGLDSFELYDPLMMPLLKEYINTVKRDSLIGCSMARTLLGVCFDYHQISGTHPDPQVKAEDLDLIIKKMYK